MDEVRYERLHEVDGVEKANALLRRSGVDGHSYSVLKTWEYRDRIMMFLILESWVVTASGTNQAEICNGDRLAAVLAGAIDVAMLKVARGLVNDKPMTKDELAAYLGVSESTVRELVKEGMPHIRIRVKKSQKGDARFFPSDVKAWLQRRTAENL